MPYCSYGPKWSFLTKFQVKISQRVFPVQKRSRYEKSFKFFILSENVAKKDFSHPKCTQNHKWQIANFETLRYVICGFECVLGAKSPFWQHFRKVGQFQRTFHTLIVSACEKLAEIFWVEIWREKALCAYRGNMGQNTAIFEWPTKRSQNSIPKEVVQDR